MYEGACWQIICMLTNHYGWHIILSFTLRSLKSAWLGVWTLNREGVSTRKAQEYGFHSTHRSVKWVKVPQRREVEGGNMGYLGGREVSCSLTTADCWPLPPPIYLILIFFIFFIFFIALSLQWGSSSHSHWVVTYVSTLFSIINL